MDEILFLQELEKADEVTVVGRASPILNGMFPACRRQPQRRAHADSGARPAGRLPRCRVFTDKFHELQCEPQRAASSRNDRTRTLATGTHINGDLCAQRPPASCSHFGSTTGTS